LCAAECVAPQLSLGLGGAEENVSDADEVAGDRGLGSGEIDYA
jgi:hypothetical protein